MCYPVSMMCSKSNQIKSNQIKSNVAAHRDPRPAEASREGGGDQGVALHVARAPEPRHAPPPAVRRRPAPRPRRLLPDLAVSPRRPHPLPRQGRRSLIFSFHSPGLKLSGKRNRTVSLQSSLIIFISYASIQIN